MFGRISTADSPIPRKSGCPFCDTIRLADLDGSTSQSDGIQLFQENKGGHLSPLLVKLLPPSFLVPSQVRSQDEEVRPIRTQRRNRGQGNGLRCVCVVWQFHLEKHNVRQMNERRAPL